MDEGHYSEAEQLLRSALSEAEKANPEDSRLSLSLENLARVFEMDHKYVEAEPLYKRSLAIKESQLGLANPGVAESLTRLAIVYVAERKYAEAEPLFKRSLAIQDKALEPPGLGLALSLSSLAELYEIQHRDAEAEPLFKRSLAIREKVLGPEHPDVATSLDNLASLYESQRRYAQAEPLYKQSLAIREKAPPSAHADVAAGLVNLANLYHEEAKYSEAEPLLRRLVAIREKTLGPEHLDVATSLNDLAVLELDEGKYGEAEELFRRSLSIREKVLGPEHSAVATSLNNLAALYRAVARYGEMEPLLRRSLFILEKTLGPEHPDVAGSLNNLAELYLESGQYAEAEPLLRRSLAIFEKALGPEHPNVATVQGNLASLYMVERKYSQSESLYKSSLATREKAKGPEHLSVGFALNNLGSLYATQNKYAEAEPLYSRALAIQEKALGPEHPLVGGTLVDLASVNYSLGRPREAEKFFNRSLEVYAKQFDYLFPFMTEKEKLSFQNTLSSSFPLYGKAFPLYYSFCFKYGRENPALLGKMYDTVLWQKGFVGRSTAAVRNKIAATNDKEALSLLEKLTAKRSQLATLFFAQPANTPQANQKIDQLTQEASEIESALLKRSRMLADDKKLAHVTWQDVRQSLKPGEAAVELIKFQFMDGVRWTKFYYVALIVTPETKIAPVLVQLGEAAELEGTPVLKYRDLASANALLPLGDDSVYRSLWKPIEDALCGAQTVYLSPDDVFNSISFPVIPIGNGLRLVDKYDIRVVTSTRDLLRDAAAPASKSAVLIGDPRFELTEAQQRAAVHAASPTKNDTAGAGSGLRSQEMREWNKLAALPATKIEIDSIRSLLEKQGWKVETYTGEQATEEAIKLVQGPRVLHVATHAFFLKDQARVNSKTSLPLRPGYEYPMLRSGLFFAGADRVLRGDKPAEDLEDGILTAYEATGLNLEGTELVVLSACETGRGQIANGEGVFGLRRALHEAGAGSVLMSLWSVPDRETQELMTLFYSKWLAGQGKQQALREAEMELRARVKARYGEDRPFYWGGFVLVGR